MSIKALLCEKRDLEVKAKVIRRNGLVPAAIYGRHMDSLSIQIKEDVAIKFLRLNSIGSKVLLEIDGEEHMAILKEFQRNSLNHKIIHIEFHALTKGEKVKVTLPIKYINKDSIDQGSILQEQMNEIEISTLPEFLIDHISIDLSKYSQGDSVYVRDLDVFNDENIEVISPQESLVCLITHIAIFVEELPEDKEETDEVVEPTETTKE